VAATVVLGARFVLAHELGLALWVLALLLWIVLVVRRPTIREPVSGSLLVVVAPESLAVLAAFLAPRRTPALQRAKRPTAATISGQTAIAASSPGPQPASAAKVIAPAAAMATPSMTPNTTATVPAIAAATAAGSPSVVEAGASASATRRRISQMSASPTRPRGAGRARRAASASGHDGSPGWCWYPRKAEGAPRVRLVSW
jgi:type IV secretory pathway TrbL component